MKLLAVPVDPTMLCRNGRAAPYESGWVYFWAFIWEEKDGLTDERVMGVRLCIFRRPNSPELGISNFLDTQSLLHATQSSQVDSVASSNRWRSDFSYSSLSRSLAAITCSTLGVQKSDTTRENSSPT